MFYHSIIYHLIIIQVEIFKNLSFIAIEKQVILIRVVSALFTSIKGLLYVLSSVQDYYLTQKIRRTSDIYLIKLVIEYYYQYQGLKQQEKMKEKFIDYQLKRNGYMAHTNSKINTSRSQRNDKVLQNTFNISSKILKPHQHGASKKFTEDQYQSQLNTAKSQFCADNHVISLINTLKNKKNIFVQKKNKIQQTNSYKHNWHINPSQQQNKVNLQQPKPHMNPLMGNMTKKNNMNELLTSNKNVGIPLSNNLNQIGTQPSFNNSLMSNTSQNYSFPNNSHNNTESTEKNNNSYLNHNNGYAQNQNCKNQMSGHNPKNSGYPHNGSSFNHSQYGVNNGYIQNNGHRFIQSGQHNGTNNIVPVLYHKPYNDFINQNQGFLPPQIQHNTQNHLAIQKNKRLKFMLENLTLFYAGLIDEVQYRIIDQQITQKQNKNQKQTFRIGGMSYNMQRLIICPPKHQLMQQPVRQTKHIRQNNCSMNSVSYLNGFSITQLQSNKNMEKQMHNLMPIQDYKVACDVTIFNYENQEQLEYFNRDVSISFQQYNVFVAQNCIKVPIKVHQKQRSQKQSLKKIAQAKLIKILKLNSFILTDRYKVTSDFQSQQKIVNKKKTTKYTLTCFFESHKIGLDYSLYQILPRQLKFYGKNNQKIKCLQIVSGKSSIYWSDQLNLKKCRFQSLIMKEDYFSLECNYLLKRQAFLQIQITEVRQPQQLINSVFSVFVISVCCIEAVLLRKNRCPGKYICQFKISPKV